MKKWTLAAFPLTVLAMAMAGVVAQVDPTAGVPRISVQELKNLVKADKAVIIDVRGAEAYKAGHLPGSLCIAAGDVPEKARTLPRDKTIVTYCS